MIVIVTGATGFLGRFLVPLLTKEHDVICLGRSSVTPANVEWHQVDLASPPKLDDLPEKIDAVIHLAQAENSHAFPEGAGNIFDVNVNGSMWLLEYARKAGAKQFIFASTGSIYAPYAGRLDESDQVDPPDYFAATKLAVEKLSAPYRKHFNICIFRLFHLYGPGPGGKLISDMIEKVRSNQEIAIHGEDGAVLPITYAADAAGVLTQALKERWAGIYNLAGPESLSLRSIIETIGERLGLSPRIACVPDTTAPVALPNLDRLAEHFDPSAFSRFADVLDDFLADQEKSG